jgi:hypothetical protein
VTVGRHGDRPGGGRHGLPVLYDVHTRRAPPASCM